MGFEPTLFPFRPRVGFEPTLFRREPGSTGISPVIRSNPMKLGETQLHRRKGVGSNPGEARRLRDERAAYCCGALRAFSLALAEQFIDRRRDDKTVC